MAVILSVTTGEILKLCRLDTADATNIADANEVISNQQEAFERLLKPSAFSDSTLTAFLRRNMAKLLAAELLNMKRREDGAATSFQGVGVTVGAPPNLGQELEAEAWDALAPYRLRLAGANVGPSGAALGEPATGKDGQAALFGDSEGERTRNFWEGGL